MNNKKKIILSVLVTLLILAIGVTYAFFTYENVGQKSEVVTGQIYMNYEETSTISLTNVFPETKEQALARQDENGVFEFTITGRNTSKNPVYYEIDLLEGGLITGATESSTKILPEHVRIYLERDGEILIDGKKYNDWDNRRVFVETIPANQTNNIEHKYTLKMWIDENVTISNTNPNADYTTTEWNTAYTSLKVRVVGDFNPKELPGTMARLGTSGFWEDSIHNTMSSIKEVNFVQLDNSEIDTRYNAALIKSDVSTSTEYPVKAWLEVNETDQTKYTMYVASEEEIYFPVKSNGMFRYFTNVEIINFDNVDTSKATTMRFMFQNCENLIEIHGIEKFDTKNVTNMESVFYVCKSLKSLDLNNWDTRKLTTLTNAFNGCNGLVSLDLNDWDTSNVTDMYAMFRECSSLIDLDISGWITVNVTDMSSMFRDCINLTELNISNFTFEKINTVSSYNKMFNNVGSSLPVGTYTTVYVKDNYILNGTTYSPQNWILNLDSSHRPSTWSTANVIVKQ